MTLLGTLYRHLVTLLLGAALLTACHASTASPPSTTATATSSSCALEIPGPPLDARGRSDGLYAVDHDALGAAPLVRLAGMTWTERGADRESGKRWERVTVAPEDSARLHAYTSSPDVKDVAMVLDGQVIARHRVRGTIDHDLQVSCCDARVCDRWEALLGAPKPAR